MSGLPITPDSDAARGLKAYLKLPTATCFEIRVTVPIVVMHEFEGLLFSNCERFGNGIGRPDLAPQFQSIRDSFGTPEEINDSPHTAPSKRVEALAAGYQKPPQGTLAVLEIGLTAIGEECPHFRRRLEQLEAWPQSRN